MRGLSCALFLVIATAGVYGEFSVRNSDWVQDLMPILSASRATLLDLSLPGTHDTATYDLSDVVSDGANDLPPIIADILHDFGDYDHLGAWIRNQSTTQGVTFQEQLEGGVRYLDFRVMYTRPPSGTSQEPAWYNLHLVESKHTAEQQLKVIRTFLEEHPSEVLVMLVSRHGGCTSEFPDVSEEHLMDLVNLLLASFDGLLFDKTRSQLNTTTVEELVLTNQRLVVLTSSLPVNHTNFLLDSCQHLQNDLSPIHMENVTASLIGQRETFMNASTRRKDMKQQDKVYLLQMGGYAPRDQLLYSFFIQYNVLGLADVYRDECSKMFALPDYKNCPMTLLEVSTVAAYYNQRSFELALAQGWDLPGAIYIDAVDLNGTLHTGPQLYGPNFPPPYPPSINGEARYAYVDTVLLVMVNRLCRLLPDLDELCAVAASSLQTKRDKYPFAEWNDASTGRLAGWPQY